MPTIDVVSTSTHSAGTSVQTILVSTTATGDRIVVLSCAAQVSALPTITSVAGGGLTWSKRTRQPAGSREVVEVWWADCPSVITNVTVTVTYNTTNETTVLFAFSVFGSVGWDSNSALPAVHDPSSDGIWEVQNGVSTNDATPLVFAVAGESSLAGVSGPVPGWFSTQQTTSETGGTFGQNAIWGSGYPGVALSNATVGWNTGTTHPGMVVVDALVIAPVSISGADTATVTDTAVSAGPTVSENSSGTDTISALSAAVSTVELAHVADAAIVGKAPITVIASAGDSSANVAWTPGAGVGVPPSFYTVTPFIGSTAQSPITVPGPNPPTFLLVSGLTNGTTYTFKVSQNGGINSLPSNPVTPTTAFTPSAMELGFEVEVWDATTNVLLAILEGGTNVTIQPELNQPGAGSFQINKHDPKIDPFFKNPYTGVSQPGDPTLLAPGNFIRVKLNGQYVFAFFIEEPSLIEDSPSGPSDEVFQLQGRGAMAYMERACVHPITWTTGQTSITNDTLQQVYTNTSAGAIMYDQIQRAQLRGAIPDIHLDWNNTVDSSGTPWPHIPFTSQFPNITVHIGNDLLTLLGKLTLFGIDFFMNYAPPLTLQAFIAPHQVDRRATVVFRQGRHFGGSDKSTVQKHFSGLRTRMLVEGSGGSAAEFQDTATESDPKMGIREGYYSWGSSSDIPTLTQVSQAAVTNSENQSEPLHMSIIHDALPGGYEPFRDYGLGYIVMLDIKPNYDMVAKRIVSMTFARPQAAGSPLDYNLSIHFGSVWVDPFLKVLAIQSLGIPLIGVSPGPSTGGGGTGGGGGGSGGGVSACCGGEILMAEAFSSSPVNISSGLVVEVPLTVDTINTRIHLEADFSVIANGTITDVPVFQLGINPGGINNRGLPASAGGTWNPGAFHSPPMSVLPMGSYTAYLHINNLSNGNPWSGGPLTIVYQLLIWLVTSGSG